MNLVSFFSQSMEELEEVQQDREQLSVHISHVMEELNTKVPALQQLRRNYDQALIEKNELTGKLSKLFEEYETLQLESQDSIRLAKTKDREIARLKSSTHDLGRQVKVK